MSLRHFMKVQSSSQRSGSMPIYLTQYVFNFGSQYPPFVTNCDKKISTSLLLPDVRTLLWCPLILKSSSDGPNKFRERGVLFQTQSQTCFHVPTPHRTKHTGIPFPLCLQCKSICISCSQCCTCIVSLRSVNRLHSYTWNPLQNKAQYFFLDIFFYPNKGLQPAGNRSVTQFLVTRFTK